MAFATQRQFLSQAANQYAPQILETPRYHEAVQSALDSTERWEKRQCPLKASVVIWLILAGVLYRAESLADILTKLLSQYRQHLPGLPLDAVTPEAACKARARLGYEPVAAVYHHLAKDIRGTASFQGFRLWAVDGTFLSIADTPANEEKFGRITASRGKTAYPAVHVTELVDTVTREVKNVVVGRCDKVDERGDAMILIQELGKGDLLLTDCGFAAVWFFDQCLRRRIHILARISNCWKPKIIRTLGDGDYVVSVRGDIPAAYRLKKATVRRVLRMIVYQVGEDEPVRLLTDLFDVDKSSALELAGLYHVRWESEIVYDEQKVHLIPLQHGKQKTVFRSKSPNGVLQEVYGMLITYNIVRGMIAEAANLHDLDPRNLSFVQSLNRIELATPNYQQALDCTQREAVRSQLLKDLAGTLNPRPRRPRWYPRVVKIKMSNYGCKKPTDCGCHRDYTAETRAKPIVSKPLCSALKQLSSSASSLAVPPQLGKVVPELIGNALVRP